MPLGRYFDWESSVTSSRALVLTLVSLIKKWYPVTLFHVIPQPCCCAELPRPFQTGRPAHTLPGILPAGVTIPRRNLLHVRLPMRDIIHSAPFYLRAADWAGVPSLFL